MKAKPLEIFEKELSELNHKLAPLEWASARNNLGHAFVSLEFKESDNARLKKSIAEMEEVLVILEPNSKHDDWINIQMGYAAALHALGQRDIAGAVSLYNQSIEAYKKILPLLKRQEAPLEWALIMHNIAMVFQDLGEHSEGSRTLERSVTAYNNALTQRSAKVVPLQWALSQNNAAVALQLLGEIQQDTEILKGAITSYENACQIVTQADYPVAWVITKGNLGSLLSTLAEKTKDAGMAQQAVSNLSEIADFFAGSSNMAYQKLVKDALDSAQTGLEKITA